MMFREGRDRGHLCNACLLLPRRFVRARAFGVYDRSLRKLIHQLKYRGRFALADPLSRLLFATFYRHWRSDMPDRIIPVPLHPRKMRQRGFNQAYLLVKGWRRMAGRWGETAVPSVDTRILFRIRETGGQAGMDMAGRQRNVEGAFVVQRPESVDGAHLLLVDDVYTTGATAEACTDPLLRAGARRVDLLTLAQTPRYRDSGLFDSGLPGL
jgi:ComF family protein